MKTLTKIKVNNIKFQVLLIFSITFLAIVCFFLEIVWLTKIGNKVFLFLIVPMFYYGFHCKKSAKIKV